MEDADVESGCVDIVEDGMNWGIQFSSVQFSRSVVSDSL